MNANDEALLRALAYADIFDYPLTRGELLTRAVGAPVTAREVRSSLRRITRIRRINKRERAYYLSGRGIIVEKRKKRIECSRRKLQIARRVAMLYLRIPTVLLVAVTGGVAVGNADSADDIDLFFIVKAGTLWSTRLLVTIVTELFSKRRRPGDTELTDSICLNMFLADCALAIPKAERDLYTAHEIIQMVPLWERENSYRSFLRENSWVRRVLPNAWARSRVPHGAWGLLKLPHVTGIGSTATYVLRAVEPPARKLQLAYMKSRVTNEVVTGSVIRFHPGGIKKRVEMEYAERLHKLNLPLDKAFYCHIK